MRPTGVGKWSVMSGFVLLLIPIWAPASRYSTHRPLDDCVTSTGCDNGRVMMLVPSGRISKVGACATGSLGSSTTRRPAALDELFLFDQLYPPPDAFDASRLAADALSGRSGSEGTWDFAPSPAVEGPPGL